ncbi:MAG: hypothetical protein HHJ16_11815 [Polaromonas sp.]|uniref:hypothetical protein n=1 Tax=Polaromonas sp. TaxID=1869339 RepID=UPI001819BEA3|nr:hypothetical protein [Polaromonas sp.]NMM10942.1 hypothetical protein [Polaromonas sp.]
MNWLARLKKIDTAPQGDATEPTKPGFVGFVASGMAPMQKTGRDSPAANDAAQVLALVANSEVSTQVASPAALFADPDRWAWPHSQAMTGREIDTLTARLARFTDKGISQIDGEALADKLVTRDRDADERRLCLECVHLAGHAGIWGCGNWQPAGVATRARDARLSTALVHQLQRCDGFKNLIHESE